MSETTTSAVELSMSRQPDAVLKEAEKAASQLMELVKKRSLFKKIGPNEHLFVEAWETIGHFYQCHARITRLEYREFGDDHGFEAAADLVHIPSGKVLSSAVALCMTDEQDWKEKPKYSWESGERELVGTDPVSHSARAAMAQTRARSRAFRSVFDVIAVLAGYNPTPAEEMPTDQPRGKRKVEQPRARSGVVVTKPQLDRLFAMAKQYGWSTDELDMLLREFNYDSAKKIERKNYDAICNRVQTRDKPDGSKDQPKSWRLGYSIPDQARVVQWLKKAHSCTEEPNVEAFLKKFDGGPSDVLAEVKRWEGTKQGNLGA